MTTSQNTYDFAIIGNGILGLSLAHELRKRDRNLRIVVIGPSARTGGATVTAGAMINVWAEMGIGQFDYPALAERAEITIRGMDLWEGLCTELSEFSERPLRVQWGTYLVNNALGSPHEMRAVDYILEAMRKRGVEHSVLGPDAVPWLKPEPRGQIVRVVKLPDGRIDPRHVLAAYERALRARDVALVDDTAVKLDPGAGGVRRLLGGGSSDKLVRLAGGAEIRAGQVVLANGSFAQALIDQVPELRRETPRLVWGAGSALDVSLPAWIHKYRGIEPNIFEMDAVVRTVDRGGACGLHVVPYGSGEYYVGASSGVWFDPEPRPRVHAVHVLLRGMVEEINYGFFYGMVAVRGPGFRPVSMDTFPLLGQSHLEGVWFANGTKRDGFTCSPYICGQLASQMLGGRSTLPERFRPSRKLISYKNREQALNDYVASDFGGEAQHGLVLPPYAVQSYREGKRAKAEKVYEKRRIADFGIHPELLHLYDNDEFFAAVDHGREAAR
jgi:glycine/D-amino acid oxidase-like deaminating enzyme